MFLEPGVELGGVVFSTPNPMEFEDDVLTHVGSSSLFLELVTDAADKLFDVVLLEVVPRSVEAVSPYNWHTLDLGIVTVLAEGWVLELSSALQCPGFSPINTIAKSEYLLYGSSRNPLSGPGDPTAPHLILDDTSVWKVTYSDTHHWDPGASPEIFGVHSLGKFPLFDYYAMRSNLRQPVLLFISITDVICLTLSWDPVEHICVENAQLYTLAHELLDTGWYAGMGIWFTISEISVHLFAVAGCHTRQWDPGILQFIYMTVACDFIIVSGFREGASVPLTHKSSKVLLDKNVCSAFPRS